MKTRNVKLAYAQGWKRSRIIKPKGRAEGIYLSYTISLLREVPNEVSDKELVERWDNVSLTRAGDIRFRFHYYELLDAETIDDKDDAQSDYSAGSFYDTIKSAIKSFTYIPKEIENE